MGKSRFNDFKESNPKLSNNVLSDRLKDLINNGLIEKKFDDKLRIKYQLTPRGRNLNRVLYELAVFACKCGVEEGKHSKNCSANTLKYFKDKFQIEGR